MSYKNACYKAVKNLNYFDFDGHIRPAVMCWPPNKLQTMIEWGLTSH